MPVIKSAIKKLRQDRKREKVNDKSRDSMKSSIRLALKKKGQKDIITAISAVDKAAKNKIIHPNKAARIKSKLSKVSRPVKSTSVNESKTRTKSGKKISKKAN